MAEEEERNATIEELIQEVSRPFWRSAASARVAELRAEVERLNAWAKAAGLESHADLRERLHGAELQIDDLKKRLKDAYEMGYEMMTDSPAPNSWYKGTSKVWGEVWKEVCAQ